MLPTAVIPAEEQSTDSEPDFTVEPELDKSLLVAAALEIYSYCLEFWAQHFFDAQAFGEMGDELIVGDIVESFWPIYLEAWQDEAFIKSQKLRKFIRGHDPDAENGAYPADRKLDFIASYGHYRLLKRELGARLSRGANEISHWPCFLPATWA